MAFSAQERTDRWVKNLSTNVNPHKKFAVGGVGGLYIQVWPSGSKSWLVRLHINDGYRPMFGLGKYPEVSLKEAREKARDAKKLVAEGIDPRAYKKEQKAALILEKAKAVTFKDLAESYSNKKAIEWKFGKEGASYQRLQTHLNEYVYPSIGNLVVKDIDRDHIIMLLTKIWTTKNPTAKKVRVALEDIFGLAVSRKLRPDNPALWKGNLEHEEGLPKSSSVHKSQKMLALPFKLLPEFMAKLYATNSPESKLLAFTILTVSRPGEARVADWSEFDLENKLWTIPPGVEFDKNGKKLRENKSRKGKDHSWLIPLTTEAIKILESLPTFSDKKGLVFTSAWGNSVRNNHPIIKKLGYGDLATAHGFRSTFRTWSQEKQGKLKHFTEEACELCLKHLETTATRNAYARNQLLDDRIEILNDYESFIFQQGTVVPINEQRRVG